MVRRGFEALMGGGEPAYDEWHPDFVWDMSTYAGWPEDETYEGVEGFERFMRNWREPFDDWQIEVEEYLDAGDKVVVLLHQQGTARASGATVHMTFAQLWSFRAGKAVRVQLYADPDEALAVAGIER